MNDNSTKPFFIKPSHKSADDFQDLFSRDYEVRISAWLSEGWDLLKKDAGVSIAFAALGVVCYILANVIPFAGMLVFYPLIAGFIVVSLMFFNNQPTEFKNYFMGFRHFIPLLVFSIISSLMLAVGYLLLVLPGIYLTVAYLFAAHVIIEKNVDFWPAMEISRKRMNQHWFGMFLFALILVVVNIAGFLLFVIGLFVTLPFTMYALTAAYRDIFMLSGPVVQNVTAQVVEKND